MTTEIKQQAKEEVAKHSSPAAALTHLFGVITIILHDYFTGKQTNKMIKVIYVQILRLYKLTEIVKSTTKKKVIIETVARSIQKSEQQDIKFSEEILEQPLFMDNGQVDLLTEREMKKLSDTNIPDLFLENITTDIADINDVPGYIREQEIDSELEEAALKKEQRKKAAIEKKLARPLDVNILSEGITSPLQRADIITVGDLAELSFSELMEIPRIGILKAWTIREYLADLKVPVDESMIIPKKKTVRKPKKTGLPTILQAAANTPEEERKFVVPFTEKEFIAKQKEMEEANKDPFKDPLYTRIIHIDYAELPWRYQSVLIDNGIHTIRDLIELDIEQLKAMKKMGAGGIEFISKMLYKKGLSLKIGSMPKHDAPKSDRLKPISL